MAFCLGKRGSICTLGAGGARKRPRQQPLPRKQQQQKQQKLQHFERRGADKGSRKEQMVLDFGQKSLGKKVVCSVCSLLYCVGDVDDELAHKRHCDPWRFGVACKAWKFGVVVDHDPKDDARILQVKPGDAASQASKLECLQDIVQKELGMTDFAARPLHHFLFVRRDRIVGYLTAEQIRDASRVLTAEEGDSSGPEMHLETNTSKVPATLGIHAVWVHQTARRCGVATRLLDAARRKVVFGYVTGKEQCAFTSPTSLGREFAATYCGRQDFLVYA